jgi:hypothetical protein
MGLPANEEAVHAAEERLNRRLPTALRERLLRNNGGEVRVVLEGADDAEWWPLHPVWDPTSKETMRRSANHIVQQQESAREWPSFPADAISIAEYDGDQLILRPSDDRVHLWYHETGDVQPVAVDWSSDVERR